MDDYKKYLTTPIRKDRVPLQDLLPLDRPLRLLIDPSDKCNFRCKFCFQSKENFVGTKMSRETFDKLVGDIREFSGPINIIHMYGLGEPLVNENLPYFIKVIKDNNLAKEVAITTNGSLLTKELSEKLIASGLDRLSISLNGVSNDDFRRIVGVKVDFNKMYENIKYFYSIRKQCHLHIKINDEDYTEEQKNKFVELFKGYSDSINIDHIVNVWPGLEITDDTDKRMYEFDINTSNNNKIKRRPVCPLMFYEMLVHSDGSVSPCCVDYGFKEENLGNIMETSLFEIWNGNKLNKLRCENLLGGGYSYKICRECSYTDCAATVNITPFRDELLTKYKKD